MPDEATTLGELSELVRAKNAGPFWVTLDAFLLDAAAFERAAADGVVTPEAIAGLYGVDAAAVRIFRLPDLQVIKVSFPRAASQGSLEDRDMHSGQQHVPLASLPLPSLRAAA